MYMDSTLKYTADNPGQNGQFHTKDIPSMAVHGSHG
jgi:hypothetical protein